MSASCTDTHMRAEMYRKAAKLMEDRALYHIGPVNFACYALELAEHGRPVGGDSAFCAPMKAVFAPRSKLIAWLSDEATHDMPREERKDIRILALCFMAAMVEAGDA